MEDTKTPQVDDSGGLVVPVRRMRRFLVAAWEPPEDASLYAQSMMSEDQYNLLKIKAVDAFIGMALIHDVLERNPSPDAIWTGLSEWVAWPEVDND